MDKELAAAREKMIGILERAEFEGLIHSFGSIDGEPAVFGIELEDGFEFFVKVEPA